MSSEEDSNNIKVLLVGLAGYPKYPGKDLPGAQGDLVLWLDQIKALGVAPQQIWLATSAPSGAPTPDGRTVASVGKALPKGHTNSDGREAPLLKLVRAFAAALTPTDRALVVWAGHGYTAPNGALYLATADAESDGKGGLKGMLSWAVLTAALDQRPAACEMTFVLDTCFAAAGPEHRSFTEGRRPWRASVGSARPTDILLCASQAGQEACDLTLHGRPVGAFSWAITAVLGRWGVATDRSGWDISAADLLARTGAVLFGLDIAQTPVAEGPKDELLRPILHRPQDPEGTSAPRELGVSEIDPGTAGKVYEMSVGTSSLGQVVATTTSAALGGVPANRVWWSTLPTASFTLTLSTSGAPASPLPPGGSLYKAATFSNTSSLPTQTGTSGWVIKGDGVNVNGYMYFSGTSMVFVRTGSASTFGAGAAFTYKYPLGIPYQSTYSVAVDLTA